MKNRLQFNRHYAISQSREDALNALRARITDPDFVPLIGEPMVFRYRDENGDLQVMLVIGKKAGRSMSEREYHVIDTADLDKKIAAEVAAREALDSETIKKVIFDGVESEFADNIATLSVSANSIPIGPFEEYIGPATEPHKIHDYYTVLDAVKQVDVNFDDLADKTNKKVDGLHLVKITSGLDTNVREAYELVNLSGLPQENSEKILIYKDSSLYRVYLGHVDDRLEAMDNPTVVSGSGDAAICFIYLRTDGFYDLVAVNVETFLEENEFKDGLTVNNHEVKVKIAQTSEPFLTVDENGVKLSGVQEAINTAKAEEEARATAVENAIQAELDNTQVGAGLSGNGAYIHDHPTNYIGNATSLANADHLLDVALKAESDRAIAAEDTIQGNIDAEESRATTAESTLQSNIDAEVTRATAAEGVLQDKINTEESRATAAETTLQENINAEQARATAAENTLQDNIDAEVSERTNADEALQNELDKTQEGAGLGADGSYLHDHETSYIGAAISLANADHLLDVAVKEVSDYAIESSGALTTRIILEETRAKDTEDTLRQMISDEVARALAAETFISAVTTNIISGAGLSFGSEEGMYPENHHSGATVIGPAKSLDQADILLDLAVAGLSGELLTLSSTTKAFSGTVKDVLEYMSGETTSLSSATVNIGENLNTLSENVVSLSGAFETLSAITEDVVEKIDNLSAYTVESVETLSAITSEITASTTVYTFGGDDAGFITTETNTITDPETGKQVQRTTIKPTMPSSNWDDITGNTVAQGNGLATAYDVKQYVKDGLDGDAIWVGDMILPPPSPTQGNPLVGKIHFSGFTTSYDTVHEAFFRTDNNFTRIADSLGTDSDGYGAHFYPSAKTEDCLLISGDRTFIDAVKTLDKAIDDMDWTGETTENEVFTGITQENGHVSATTKLLSTVKLSGYTVGGDAKIAATDTLGGALGKVQGQINAMDKDASSETGKFVRTVVEADGKITEEQKSYIVADDVKITAATAADIQTLPNPAAVKEAYKLVNQTGATLGSLVPIYKDSSIKEIYLGTSADTVNATTGVITKLEGDKESLNYVYHKEDGTYEMTKIDLEQFLTEPEFKDGLIVDGHLVKVKIDPTSEEYLTVGANGVKLTGIDALSASVVTNKNNISSLSAGTIQLSADTNSVIATLSAGTIQLSADTKNAINALSGNTHGVINALSASVATNKNNISSLSAGTIQLSADTNSAIATLSAGTIQLSADTKGVIGALSASVVTNKNNVSSLSAGTIQLSADTSAAIAEAVAAAVLDSVSVAADGNSTKVTVKVGGVTKSGSAVVPYATNADTVDGKHISVVSSLPSQKDANTIYILI